jgi:hypothetical protein
LCAFYQTLLARHKSKLRALIAVARKMLHAIFGVSRWPCDTSLWQPLLKKREVLLHLSREKTCVSRENLCGFQGWAPRVSVKQDELEKIHYRLRVLAYNRRRYSFASPQERT